MYCIGVNNKEKNVEKNKIIKCRKNVYISAVYSTVIWCLALLLTVSGALFLEVSNAFYCGKISQILPKRHAKNDSRR